MGVRTRKELTEPMKRKRLVILRDIINTLSIRWLARRTLDAIVFARYNSSGCANFLRGRWKESHAENADKLNARR